MAIKFSKRNPGNKAPVQTFAATWRRYLFTGALLGIYFGYFFRPLREPSLRFVLTISTVVMVVTLAIRLWRGERRPPQLLRLAVMTWLQVALFLAVLEGRHLAFDWGGRWAVILLTTVAGALSGLYWAYANDVARTKPERR